jgi:aspartate/methionine/tyrosine aminotransferase
MKLEQFQMERMQSTWENLVKYNLSESGVHPVTIGELIPEASERESLLNTELGYGQGNGTPELRSLIASMYPGASQANVMVTTGGSEANFLVSWLLTEPGDEAVMMTPNYMQLWGLLRGFGAEVKSFNLVEELNWAPDLDQLETVLSSKTKLIAICNPNNPTGAVLTEIGCPNVGGGTCRDDPRRWVYRGAELDGDTTLASGQIR